MNMKGMTMAAGWLVIVGAVVLGLQGLIGSNFLGMLLGEGSMLERVANLLIGAAGVLLAYNMLMGKKGK